MKVSYPAEKNTSLQNGFYPIGYYHCWHGGIHIEGVENKTPIKAIADGKIIAFRYNQELKKVKGKGGKEFFFSNNFVVIRHDYESSGKKKMTFYSLYQHLSFGSQQQKEESKPKEQNKENIYTVKIKVFKQESGVFSSDGKSFIPLYSQVQIQSKDEVQGIYQVAFEGKNVQIPQEKNQTKTLNESGRIVFWGDKRGDRGLLLYSQARSNTPTKGVIKDGEKVTILDKTEVQGKDKKHTWYKVGYQGKEGFILEEHLATKPSESKEAQKNDTGKTATEPNLLPKFLKSYSPKDEVVTCDIDVKAGELIGWVGKQGLFNNPNYVATHIEVFTPDDGKEFIENKQKQGDNEKFYFELKKGTELKSYLKLNFVSPPYHKGTRVKVISKTATYTKVQPIEEVFIKEVHRWTAFDDIVDGKAIEKRWLSPEKRKTFWIENEYVELAKGKKEYVFTSSLSHIYLTDPERETQTRS
ncbi:SH3 domain-containing protein, partial [Capnocytophaga felis]|uniref:SH3 domain-containing protein n=1 Tax=Capnocytophaga felis TaxID=2267611 RepID=UPI0012D2A4EF